MKILLLEEPWTLFHMVLMEAVCSILNCFPLMGEDKETIFASLQAHIQQGNNNSSYYLLSTLCWVLYIYTTLQSSHQLCTVGITILFSAFEVAGSENNIPCKKCMESTCVNRARSPWCWTDTPPPCLTVRESTVGRMSFMIWTTKHFCIKVQILTWSSTSWKLSTSVPFVSNFPYAPLRDELLSLTLPSGVPVTLSLAGREDTKRLMLSKSSSQNLFSASSFCTFAGL